MYARTNQGPTDVLETEHRIVQRVVANMARIAEALERGKTVEVSALRELVRFLKVFADQCHHAKEEVSLFPMFELKGVPVEGCPIGVLRNDHVKGCVMVAELNNAVEGYASNAQPDRHSLIVALRKLIDFCPGNISKEDYLLFPLAKKVLSSTDERILTEQFEKIETSLGPHAHDRFKQFVTELDLATSKRQEPCPVCETY